MEIGGLYELWAKRDGYCESRFFDTIIDDFCQYKASWEVIVILLKYNWASDIVAYNHRGLPSGIIYLLSSYAAKQIPLSGQKAHQLPARS